MYLYSDVVFDFSRYILHVDMPDISLLYCLHKISCEADIEIDYVALGRRSHRDVYEAEANRVVNLLKSAQLYDMARAFANAADLSADDVTIDQVSNAISHVLQLADIRQSVTRILIVTHTFIHSLKLY